MKSIDKIENKCQIINDNINYQKKKKKKKMILKNYMMKKNI